MEAGDPRVGRRAAAQVGRWQRTRKVTVELENGSGQGLGAKLDEHEVEEETRKKLGDAIAVSADGPRLFLYADTRESAEQARDLVRSILAEEDMSATFSLDRWHPLAEEWEPGDDPLPDTEEEQEEEREEAEAQDAVDTAASGYAEWEVRIDLPERPRGGRACGAARGGGVHAHAPLEAPAHRRTHGGRRERARRASARRGAAGRREVRSSRAARWPGRPPQALEVVLHRPEHVVTPRGRPRRRLLGFLGAFRLLLALGLDIPQRRERDPLAREEDRPDADPDRGLDQLQPDAEREALRVADAVMRQRHRDRRLHEPDVPGPEGSTVTTFIISSTRPAAISGS